jgi:hypothetical protein
MLEGLFRAAILESGVLQYSKGLHDIESSIQNLSRLLELLDRSKIACTAFALFLK